MSNISRLTTLAAAGAGGPPTEFGQAYGGGYYTGNIVQGGIEYYLIVAPKASGYSSSKQFKTSNTAAPSATRTLNNGPAASASMNSAAYPAAQFCEALSIGGYTDWYLPARDEIELYYRNLKAIVVNNNTNSRGKSSYTYPEGNDVVGDTMGVNRNSNPVGAAYTAGTPSQTSITKFQTGGSEALSVGSNVWSSSEWSSSLAWYQSTYFGLQGSTSKTATLDGCIAFRREPV